MTQIDAGVRTFSTEAACGPDLLHALESDVRVFRHDDPTKITSVPKQLVAQPEFCMDLLDPHPCGHGTVQCLGEDLEQHGSSHRHVGIREVMIKIIIAQHGGDGMRRKSTCKGAI